MTIIRRIGIVAWLAGVLALALVPVALADGLFNPPNAPAIVRNFPGGAPCNTTLAACVSGSGSGDVISIANGFLSVDLVVITHPLTACHCGGCAPKGRQDKILRGLRMTASDGFHRTLHVSFAGQ